jgi:hypothetical protein
MTAVLGKKTTSPMGLGSRISVAAQNVATTSIPNPVSDQRLFFTELERTIPWASQSKAILGMELRQARSGNPEQRECRIRFG